MYVTIVATDKTMGKFSRPANDTLIVENLTDGMNAVLAEIQSGVVPPVGGRIVDVPSTGEIAFVGFGSAVVYPAQKAAAATVNEFTDVNHKTVNDTSYRSIYWAVDNGIVKGFNDGSFQPETICTREQFSIMLWRSVVKLFFISKGMASSCGCLQLSEETIPMKFRYITLFQQMYNLYLRLQF